MALMKCRECGHQVSSEAAACPNCGAKPKTDRSIGLVTVVLILFTGSLLLKWALSGGAIREPGSTTAAVASPDTASTAVARPSGAGISAGAEGTPVAPKVAAPGRQILAPSGSREVTPSRPAVDACAHYGDRIALEGSLETEIVQPASGPEVVAWVLKTSRPLCVESDMGNHGAAVTEQVARFQVFGPHPEAGSPRKFAGIVSTVGEAREYALNDTIFVPEEVQRSPVAALTDTRSSPPSQQAASAKPRAEIQFDQASADEAALLERLTAQTNACLHDTAALYLRVGLHDEAEIIAKQVAVCGGQLIRFSAYTYHRLTEEQAQALVVTMARRQLSRVAASGR